tara:strand:- start:9167 stop:9388 length:222 start_codon:yes stop_codon:yes gene_type:complete
MNKDKFWREYHTIKETDLPFWFGGLNPLDKNKIKDRVRELTLEICHGAYYDGWTLEGLKKENKKLSTLLRENI